MKKLFKVATIATTLAIATNVANASDKIGFIAPEFVIQNHPLLSSNSDFAKNIAEQNKLLTEENKKLEEEYKALNQEAAALKAEENKITKVMAKKANDLKKKAPRLRRKEIEKRQNEILSLESKFKKKVIAFQQKEMAFKKKESEFQQKSENVRIKFANQERQLRIKAVADIEGKLKELAKAKGYTLILNSSAVAFTSKDENNVSEEILKAVGGIVPTK